MKMLDKTEQLDRTPNPNEKPESCYCSALPKGSGPCLPCYTRWLAADRKQSRAAANDMFRLRLMLRPSSAAVATIFGNGQTRLKELFYCAFSSIRGAAVGSNPNSCGPLPDGRPVKVTARLWPVIVTAIFWPEIARLIHRHAPSPVVIPTATATICGFRDRCHDGRQ